MNHPLHSFFRMVQQSRATLYQVPVYSIRYLEWLVDVPLLMILGKDERPGCQFHIIMCPVGFRRFFLVSEGFRWCFLLVSDDVSRFQNRHPRRWFFEPSSTLISDEQFDPLGSQCIGPAEGPRMEPTKCSCFGDETTHQHCGSIWDGCHSYRQRAALRPLFFGRVMIVHVCSCASSWMFLSDMLFEFSIYVVTDSYIILYILYYIILTNILFAGTQCTAHATTTDRSFQG